MSSSTSRATQPVTSADRLRKRVLAEQGMRGLTHRAVAAAVGAPLVVVPRRWLSQLLVDALPAGTVRGYCTVALDGRHTTIDGRVAALRQHPDGVEVDGQRADAVVAADGAHSGLRAALFPGHPGLRGSGEYAARAIAPAVDPPVVRGELLDHRTGDRFGCMPMADGNVYWYATWRTSAPADPAARHRWLCDRRADWHPSVAALIEATATRGIHVVETAQLARPLPALVGGRVALLGDAAHAMTPDLGQGACQAFEDAVALAAVLDTDVPASLARYDEIRGPRTRTLQRQCRRMHRLLTLRGPAGRLRDCALRRVPPSMTTAAMAAQLRFTPQWALH